ncbi:pyrroline-5-carboxylate reductase family protein [Candidatus Omnitrophota bacterium]
MGTIAIIGYGNMGSAIGERIKAAYQVWAFDKDRAKTRDVKGINISQNAADPATKADILILAVKPQDFDSLLAEIKKPAVGKLVISIAAGVSTAYIENKLEQVRVIRVMPNLPAKIGQGMICLSKGSIATDDDLSFAKGIFDYMGTTMVIEEEAMNNVTAISGSGPGYFYNLIQGMPKEEIEEYAKNTFIPELSKSAKAIGFDPERAVMLAKVTTAGAIVLLENTKLSPEALCSQVTSQGGTTEAGLAKLNHNIVYLGQAVEAAKKRAEELSRKE